MSSVWELLPMNDFTKEDLHCLHNAIDIQLKTVPMSKLNVQRRRELLEKLQSMIDNYCEHDFEETDSVSFIWRCKKCGII